MFSSRLMHGLLILVNSLLVVALLATAGLIWLESRWAQPDTTRNPAAAFVHGSIGTELMPVVVARVLPAIFPEHFQPRSGAGDWVEQFGFIRAPKANGKADLPLGFALSNYRPGSAAPSPVQFVGFSCALCHTTTVRTAYDRPAKLVSGPGSVSLNLFAWLDAFQASILAKTGPDVASGDAPHRYRLNVSSIREAHRRLTGQDISFAERVFVGLWLREMRRRLEAAVIRFDEPYGHGRSFDPDVTPTGPTRTQPFRTIVRQVLQRPGADMAVYTKIATVYSQDARRRAQFDGTIGDLYARSSLAALAAGATVDNLRHPEIAHNIRAASDYTRTLRAPPFVLLFPDHAPPSAPRLSRGAKVYRAHCYACHGGPGRTGWHDGPRTHQIATVAEVGTDPERVMFRHYGTIPERLFRLFDEDHPFRFDRNTIWPQRGTEQNAEIRGYINAPIDGAYLRAPYLHNASILTLAELINLKPRREVFLRGHNLYDPVDIGFTSPSEATPGVYFRFDTRSRGNSNAGHDYPWAFADPNRNVEDLQALLDYLKTL